MRRARWKRKGTESKLAHLCKFGECGSQLFCSEICFLLRGTGGVRISFSLVHRADSHMKPRDANRTPSAPLSAAAPPHPQRGFQRGGPQPAPLCRFKGVRGEIEIPPRFSLGGRGDILFSKENIPLASPYRAGTFHREFPLWEQETHTGSPYSAQVLLSVIFTSIKLPIRPLSPFSRTSRLPSVREARGKFSSSLSPSTSTRTVLPT